MNTRIYGLILVLFNICYSYSQESNNKQLQITPYAGISLPQGNFNDFSENGNTFGIAVDKYISNKFALGLDFNYQSNKFSNPFDYSAIATPAMLSMNTNKNWNVSSFLLGPTYKIGRNKFNVEFYTKAGISILKTPSQSTSFSQSGTSDISLLEIKEDNVTALSFNSGIRFNYGISKKLSVFFNPQYQFISKDIEYFHRPITTDVISNPDLLAIDGGELCYIKPSYLNVNFGISLNLGGAKSQIKDNEETVSEVQGLCDETKLKSPYNGETYFADSGIVPEFNWINYSKPDAKSYVFELFSGEKRIFEKKAKKPNFKFTKKMTTDFYGLEGIRDYRWRVITNYNNCESKTTGFKYFTIQPSQNSSSRTAGPSDCIYDFINIDLDCDATAYDEEGNIKYVGTFTVKNESTVSGILIPHSSAGNNKIFDVVNPNGVLTISNGSFNSSCPAVPMINMPGYTGYSAALQPNQQVTFCFELTMPISDTSIEFVAGMVTRPGTTDQAICGPSQIIELPNCICNVCEDREHIDTEHNLKPVNLQGIPFNFQIVQELQIVNVDPIIEVKAEIISVQHVANDPQCYTCTKHENEMGLFSFESIKPRIIGSGNWTFNGEGQIGKDDDNISKDTNEDNYTNQIVWQAKDPTVGVDFSTSKRFVLPISLPSKSNLDCCEHEYKVCVRYTYKDINCVTCSYDQCYVSNGNILPIDIGDQSGNVIINKPSLTLKKN